MRIHENNSRKKSGTNHKKSSPKHNSLNFAERDIYNKINLDRLIKHLRELKRKNQNGNLKEFCVGKETSEVRTDTQVKLRCHQLPNVVRELRKAVLRQDWDEAVTLLMILCHPGLKLYTSIILRTCCILFFNHPNSNMKLLEDFIRLITGYILDQDVNKFIRILFALRKSALTISEHGKYIRKTAGQKVTREFEFENL